MVLVECSLEIPRKDVFNDTVKRLASHIDGLTGDISRCMRVPGRTLTAIPRIDTGLSTSASAFNPMEVAAVDPQTALHAGKNLRHTIGRLVAVSR